MFESLRLLAPTSAEGIDEKIKELRDREELFLRVSREESNEEEKQLAEEIKTKQGKKEQKAVKKQEEEDFPTIWLYKSTDTTQTQQSSYLWYIYDEIEDE